VSKIAETTNSGWRSALLYCIPIQVKRRLWSVQIEVLQWSHMSIELLMMQKKSVRMSELAAFNAACMYDCALQVAASPRSASPATFKEMC
jgi:hypothetical protein